MSQARIKCELNQRYTLKTPCFIRMSYSDIKIKLILNRIEIKKPQNLSWLPSSQCLVFQQASVSLRSSAGGE